MQLISKGTFEALHRPQKNLQIEPYDERSYEVNCYYFHLGALKQGERIVKVPDGAHLRRGQACVVFTLERFVLNERVFAILGPCSELFLKGLALYHSPTIDPGFDGALELRLHNLSDRTVPLQFGMRIGKVVFFDVSDTIMHLDKYVRVEREKVAWVARRRAAEEIRKLAEGLTKEELFPSPRDIWVEKTIDSEWGESGRRCPFLVNEE